MIDLKSHKRYGISMWKRWTTISLVAFAPVLVAGYFYVERVDFVWLFSAYGLLSLGRIGFQVLTSNYVLSRPTKLVALPPASLIVPVFNEDPATFKRALLSFKRIDYPNLEVIIVDDGSDNPPVNERLVKDMGFKYIYKDNAGKREAMYMAFGFMNPASRVVLTSDSDTLWKPNAARELVSTLLSSPRTGAVTGFVDVLNPNVNLLTKLVYLRYYMAFNQERAAQSLFGSVTCVSGPLGAYRRDLIDRVKERFVSQHFMGKKCTFGDDRHLTNLMFLEGYQVKYAPRAICYTEAPTKFFQYLTQQTRWGKSHWREMTVQFKALPKQSLYLSYDWILTLLLPFLLAASIAHYLYLAATSSPKYLGYLFATMLLMSLVKVIDPIRQTRRPIFLLFVLYSAFHLLILLPLKFVSLATINKTGWGTRKVGLKPV